MTNPSSNPSTNVVIASAARTAVGSFNGSFANTPAHELGVAAIKAALARAGSQGYLAPGVFREGDDGAVRAGVGATPTPDASREEVFLG